MINRITKFREKYKVVIIPTLIILFLWYMFIFMQEGLYFYDTFLVKEETEQVTTYSGEHKAGHLVIEVDEINDEEATVEYNLPNNKNFKYTVKKTVKDYYDYHIQIFDENGVLIFKGFHLYNARYLLDEYQEPILDDLFASIKQDTSTIRSDYEPSHLNIVKRALLEKETVRGDFQKLIMAIFLSIFIIVDMINPMFFFYLRNFLSVKNPEPTDFYKGMQRLAWVVYPIIIVFVLIGSIS